MVALSVEFCTILVAWDLDPKWCNRKNSGTSTDTDLDSKTLKKNVIFTKEEFLVTAVVAKGTCNDQAASYANVLNSVFKETPVCVDKSGKGLCPKLNDITDTTTAVRLSYLDKDGKNVITEGTLDTQPFALMGNGYYKGSKEKRPWKVDFGDDEKGSPQLLARNLYIYYSLDKKLTKFTFSTEFGRSENLLTISSEGKPKDCQGYLSVCYHYKTYSSFQFQYIPTTSRRRLGMLVKNNAKEKLLRV